MPKAIVTAGPTYEPLDEVRRLTNHSTGRLGIELTNYLTTNGVSVTLLKGYYSTYAGRCSAHKTLPFTTTESLDEHLTKLSNEPYDAIFHAAAVSDFQFGRISNDTGDDSSEDHHPGKWSTRSGTLLAELVPTKKILPELRSRYPKALLVGWKYEVDGDQATAIEKGERQLIDSKSDLSIVNGPAYGSGFGIVSRTGSLRHVSSHESLYEQLNESLFKRIS